MNLSADLPRLCDTRLGQLPTGVRTPGYDREQVRRGIVHLGIGAFMRAHLAVATEAALNSGDLRWGIVGVSLRQPDTRDALVAQGGLYTLALRSGEGSGAHTVLQQSLQVVGAVQTVLVAPENPGAVLQAMAAADTRIVSLTVTEKGYCHDPASGQLRLDHPDIVHDLAHADSPRSAVGYIVRALALRRSQGHGGITLMSLDNLPANGRVLRQTVLALAGALEQELANWIASHCSFPCSMVDRIVPRTTPADAASISVALGHQDAWPVLGEPFFDWAVEDHFVAERPDWSLGGARFVADAAPWERLKLRMVNGTHSSLAYLSVMAGWSTVDVAMAQPAMQQYIEALMHQEIEPTLPALPGLDLTHYRVQLQHRFANPALAHRTAQIAMDGSQKLPQRLLATIRERLESNAAFPRLALGVAAWLYFLRGVDEAGQSFTVDDPLAETLTGLVRQSVAQDLSPATMQQLLGFAPVFANLGANPRFVEAITSALRALLAQGVVYTLNALV